MSIHNRYSDIPLTEEDLTSFDAQLAIIEEIVSALQEPDSLILRRVAKLGVKSDAFTRDALMLAAHHEELLPRGLDVQELKAQMRLRDELKRRTLAMKLMTRKMELIVQLLGSDVFSGALAAYKAMKTNHRGTLNEELRELGRLFRNRRKGGAEDQELQGKDEGSKTRDASQTEHAVEQPREKSALMNASKPGSSPGANASGPASTGENSPVQQMISDSVRAVQPPAHDRIERDQGTPQHTRNPIREGAQANGKVRAELLT